MTNDLKSNQKKFKVTLLKETLFFFVLFVLTQLVFYNSADESILGRHPVWFLLYAVVAAVIGALGNMYLVKKFSKKAK